MKKNNDKQKKNEENEICENESCKCCENEDTKAGNTSNETENKATDANKLDEVMAKLSAREKQCEEYYSMLQRTAAEFDNYKKRTAKEKESLYTDAVCDVIQSILPVVDNFERAISASGSGSEGHSSLEEGIGLVYKQLKDTLKNIGIEEIKCVGESFDPQLHNAVMHIEDESYGENIVIEEFQKGYTFKDKVVRHSMVKVAN